MEIKSIKSLQELKEYCANEPKELYIKLNYGARSSKDVTYWPETGNWEIWHGIDDTSQSFEDDKQLEKEYPLLMEALKTDNLLKY